MKIFALGLIVLATTSATELLKHTGVRSDTHCEIPVAYLMEAGVNKVNQFAISSANPNGYICAPIDIQAPPCGLLNRYRLENGKVQCHQDSHSLTRNIVGYFEETKINMETLAKRMDTGFTNYKDELNRMGAEREVMIINYENAEEARRESSGHMLALQKVLQEIEEHTGGRHNVTTGLFTQASYNIVNFQNSIDNYLTGNDGICKRVVALRQTIVRNKIENANETNGTIDIMLHESNAALTIAKTARDYNTGLVNYRTQEYVDSQKSLNVLAGLIRREIALIGASPQSSGRRLRSTTKLLNHVRNYQHYLQDNRQGPLRHQLAVFDTATGEFSGVEYADVRTKCETAADGDTTHNRKIQNLTPILVKEKCHILHAKACLDQIEHLLTSSETAFTKLQGDANDIITNSNYTIIALEKVFSEYEAYRRNLPLDFLFEQDWGALNTIVDTDSAGVGLTMANLLGIDSEVRIYNTVLSFFCPSENFYVGNGDNSTISHYGIHKSHGSMRRRLQHPATTITGKCTGNTDDSTDVTCVGGDGANTNKTQNIGFGADGTTTSECCEEPGAWTYTSDEVYNYAPSYGECRGPDGVGTCGTNCNFNENFEPDYITLPNGACTDVFPESTDANSPCVSISDLTSPDECNSHIFPQRSSLNRCLYKTREDYTDSDERIELDIAQCRAVQNLDFGDAEARCEAVNHTDGNVTACEFTRRQCKYTLAVSPITGDAFTASQLAFCPNHQVCCRTNAQNGIGDISSIAWGVSSIAASIKQVRNSIGTFIEKMIEVERLYQNVTTHNVFDRDRVKVKAGKLSRSRDYLQAAWENEFDCPNNETDINSPGYHSYTLDADDIARNKDPTTDPGKVRKSYTKCRIHDHDDPNGCSSAASIKSQMVCNTCLDYGMSYLVKNGIDCDADVMGADGLEKLPRATMGGCERNCSHHMLNEQNICAKQLGQLQSDAALKLQWPDITPPHRDCGQRTVTKRTESGKCSAITVGCCANDDFEGFAAGNNVNLRPEDKLCRPTNPDGTTPPNEYTCTSTSSGVVQSESTKKTCENNGGEWKDEEARYSCNKISAEEFYTSMCQGFHKVQEDQKINKVWESWNTCGDICDAESEAVGNGDEYCFAIDATKPKRLDNGCVSLLVYNTAAENARIAALTPCDVDNSVAITDACKCDVTATTHECAINNFCWTDNTCNTVAATCSNHIQPGGIGNNVYSSSCATTTVPSGGVCTLECTAPGYSGSTTVGCTLTTFDTTINYPSCALDAVVCTRPSASAGYNAPSADPTNMGDANAAGWPVTAGALSFASTCASGYSGTVVATACASAGPYTLSGCTLIPATCADTDVVADEAQAFGCTSPRVYDATKATATSPNDANCCKDAPAVATCADTDVVADGAQAFGCTSPRVYDTDKDAATSPNDANCCKDSPSPSPGPAAAVATCADTDVDTDGAQVFASCTSPRVYDDTKAAAVSPNDANCCKAATQVTSYSMTPNTLVADETPTSIMYKFTPTTELTGSGTSIVFEITHSRAWYTSNSNPGCTLQSNSLTCTNPVFVEQEGNKFQCIIPDGVTLSEYIVVCTTNIVNNGDPAQHYSSITTSTDTAASASTTTTIAEE